MRWLLIGSVAAKRWWPEFRAPRDIDILTPAKIAGSDSQVCVVESSWHEAAELLLSLNQDEVFLDPDLLYTLKVSHAEWNIKWEKTMADISFMQAKGCQLHEEAYAALVPVWRRVHGKKHVNMARPMTEFFNDAVVREHDHERLHELVAFTGKPMHERLRSDLSTAWCDTGLFAKLSADEQAYTALEETLATAIERGKLTADSLKSERVIAVNRAYKQLVTSMTTGWFAKFLILNYLNLLRDRRPQWEHQLNTALTTLQLSR